MKNKVIEILDDMIDENPEYESPKRDAIEEAIYRIKSIPDDDWIAVTDEYPEDNTDVLVCGQYGVSIGSGYAHELGHWIWYATHGKITHWMNLPTPPLPLPTNK